MAIVMTSFILCIPTLTLISAAEKDRPVHENLLLPLSPATLQQVAPPRCAFLGQSESAILSMGRCLLRAAPHTRQEPRLRPTLLAKNALENVADRHPL